MARGRRLAALLALALAPALGCGRASYHAELKEGDTVEVGKTLADVIAKHGFPDSVREISSSVYALQYAKVELQGFLPGRLVERRSSLSYVIRGEKVVSPGTFHETASALSGLGDESVLDAPALRGRPLVAATAAGAVLVSFLIGTLVGRRRPRGARRGIVAAVVLAGLAYGARESGSASPDAVQEGSHVSELVNRHGPIEERLVLPVEGGTLFAFRSHERRDLILAGTESSSHVAYLVQGSRVARASGRVRDAVAQYYGFPFYELDRAPRPSVAGTVASVLVLAALAFAGGARLARRLAPPSSPAALLAPES